jgi:hypothetical protein
VRKHNIDGGAAVSIAAQRDTIPKDAPRWLFSASDFPGTKGDSSPAGGIDFGSPCIVPFRGMPGFMNRCLITPCITVPRRVPKQEVPIGTDILTLNPGRDDMGRVTDYVDIPLYPAEELQYLMLAYKAWGLREITTLIKRSPEEVAPLQINTTIFPDWPTLPNTNAELKDYLQRRRTHLGRTHAARDVFVALIDELLEAVDTADAWQRRHLDAVHSSMRLPPEHLEHKPAYDPVDITFLERTGVPRYDSGLRNIAESQAAIGQLLASQVTNAGGGSGMTAEQFADTLKSVLRENAAFVQSEIAKAIRPQAPETPPETPEGE